MRHSSLAADARIGVVGATGAVGTITVELLRERGYRDVRLFASERSAGRRLGGTLVEEATPETLAAGDLDLCLFSVGTSASRELVPHAVSGGATCIDKSAAFRLEPGVPLVVPEVNGHRAAEHTGILANPNCCAIPLTCALKPLHDAAGLARVRVATYQSVSGAGARAMDRLREQSPEANDLSMDWAFDGVEFDEEEKLREETRKILELPELRDQRDLRSRPRPRRPRRGGLARDRGAALARAGDRDPEHGTRNSAGAVPHSGSRRRRRRRPRRPDPSRSDDRERPRAVHRRRQPAEGRRAERDPDRGAPPSRATRRRLSNGHRTAAPSSREAVEQPTRAHGTPSARAGGG